MPPVSCIGLPRYQSWLSLTHQKGGARQGNFDVGSPERHPIRARWRWNLEALEGLPALWEASLRCCVAAVGRPRRCFWRVVARVAAPELEQSVLPTKKSRGSGTSAAIT